MSSTIGYSVLQVIPSAKGFAATLSQQVNPGMGKAGVAGGKAYGEKMVAAAKSFAAPLLGAFATVKVVGLFKDAIAGASDLNESASKVGVVFGESSDQIMKASKTSARAMGLSRNAYLDASGTLGNLLVSLDIAPDKAADMSQAMVKLAGDMASFNNASPEDTLLAIRSGLTGETEPLKRFGVNMNESTLKLQAMKMGLITTTTQALDPQTKALAAQALILAQTGTAQGDFARTSGGLANQQRIAAAQVEDLKTKLGQGLLPITITVTTAFNKFVAGMMDGTGAGGKFKDFLVTVYKDALKPIISFLVTHKSVIGKWVVNLGLMFLAFKALLFVTKVTAALKLFVATLSYGTAGLKAMYGWELRVATLNPFGWVALAVTGLALLWKSLDDNSGKATNQLRNMAGGGRGAGNAIAAATVASAAAIAAQAASTDHPTRSPKTGFVPKVPGGKGGGGIVDPAKLLDAINLKIAVENQKKTLGDFLRYLGSDFIASVKDSGTKASDVIGKLVSGVDGLAKGFAATITDSVKQGSFNLASTKIVNALETKLLGFQSAFDDIQTAREKLKTQITDADSALKDAIKLRSDAAGSIADLLSKPFGQPSELVKQLSGAEASADSILSGYNSMVKMVQDRFASIKGGKKDALLGFLKESTAQLLDFAKQRADTAKLLEDAQNKLEDAIKTKSTYADNLSSGLKTAAYSLSEFFDKEKGAASPAGIIAGFKARLDIVKNFSTNLKALAGRGLNQGLIDQIVGMGTTEGGALAASLATAGDDQIATLNATGVEIAATADSLGSALSDKFYGQSVANAQSIVKGYKDTQEMINAAMRSITSGIALEMSPLTDSMASLGEDSAQALLDGFKSQDNALIAQAASLGARMAQAVADALSALKVVSGGADFGVANAKATAAKMADDAAKLLKRPPSIATADVAVKLAQIQETERENRRLTQSKAATSADIAALANRLENAMSGQARTLQRMDRQGGR